MSSSKRAVDLVSLASLVFPKHYVQQHAAAAVSSETPNSHCVVAYGRREKKELPQIHHGAPATLNPGKQKARRVARL